MRRTSVAFPDSLVEKIDDERHSTVSRSDWMQRAAEMYLTTHRLGNEHTGQLPDEWWVKAMEQYLDERPAVGQNAADIEA